MNSAELEKLLAPPSEVEAQAGLGAFAKAAQERYGARLAGLFLYGSRARRDHRADSDADVAVVLADTGWSFLAEKLVLSELSMAVLADFGLYVQAWPFTEAEWAGREPSRNLGAALATARTDAKPLVATR